MSFVYHTARGLTGGGSTDLDSFTTASLTDGNTHVCFTYDSSTNKIYAHVFDSTATDAESSPDYVRPDDYSTAGVWVQQDSPSDVSAGVETGSIQIWTVDSADSSNPVALPTGYLECDGSAVSRSTYSALFAVIADQYGQGDGSTTFELPDLRGEFIRGFDNGAGNDPDAASRTDRGDGDTGDVIGSKQTDEYEAHTHTLTGNTDDSGGGSVTSGTGSYQYVGPTGSSGGNETRPRNVALMFIIKY